MGTDPSFQSDLPRGPDMDVSRHRIKRDIRLDDLNTPYDEEDGGYGPPVGGFSAGEEDLWSDEDLGYIYKLFLEYLEEKAERELEEEEREEEIEMALEREFEEELEAEREAEIEEQLEEA